jgi:multicomponent Na+:H+ antiporter subunit E
MSTITVIKFAWQKNIRLHPVIKPIKSIQKSDIGLVIYANSITLTPGTITLSLLNNDLMIHALDVELMDDLEGGKMDKIVKELVE